MNRLTEMGAFELAECIRRQEFSSEEVVHFSIDAIKDWNPKLNAMVEEVFAKALDSAKACDKQIERLAKLNRLNELPPLFGVPFTMKEMISVAGMYHTLGSWARRSDRAPHDATVVERLRDAGAILLGTTNVPELGFWFECDNPIYGRTSNPYDITRTSGGSSGGEAALIGAGASPFGVGGDVGGSIRLPAGFCGVFGHKPSNGLVPLTGHYPVYPENAHHWTGAKHPLVVIGPICRSAKDLYPLMNILMGPDGYDPEVKKIKLQPKVQSWADKTIWVFAEPQITGAASTDSEISAAVKAAAEHFEHLGANIKILRPDVFRDGVALWFAGLTKSTERSFTETLSPDREINMPGEIFKKMLGQGHFTLPALAVSFLEQFSRKHIEKLQSTRAKNDAALEKLKTEMHQLLGTQGLLIMPNHPRLAFKHRHSLTRPFDFIYAAILNALELPATAVPMGLYKGLPVSIQVVAAENQDHLCLSAAEALEAEFGGWQAPLAPKKNTARFPLRSREYFALN